MTTTHTVIELNDGDLVRMEGWASSCYASTFSVEGYARKHNEDPAAALNRALGFGHEIAQFAYIGAALVNDPSGAYRAREAQRQASAVVIPEGAIVKIEGRFYRVTSRKGNAGPFPKLSDPVLFERLETNAEGVPVLFLM